MELVEDGKNGNNDRHQVMWAVLDFRMQSSKGLTLFSIHGGIVETLTIWYACGQLGILLLSLSWDLFTLKDVGLLIGLSGGRMRKPISVHRLIRNLPSHCRDLKST